MKNDIVEVFEACIDGTLDQIDLQFEDNAAVCVVLASRRISGSLRKGLRDPRSGPFRMAETATMYSMPARKDMTEGRS